MKKATLLIVDDTPTNIRVLIDTLQHYDYKLLVARDGESALERLKHIIPDLILLDVMMPGIDGFETCEKIKANPVTKDIPIIFMTALSEPSDKVKGFKCGAVDYITKPFQTDEVLARVRTHVNLRQLQLSLAQVVEERTAELAQALAEVEKLKNNLQDENTYLRKELNINENFGDIVYKSVRFKKILKQIEQVAPTQATVLITGESGTGKELLARSVHSLSPRKEKSLITINCATLPRDLIESELFGHEKGAFTGATAKKAGRFELADKGSIFLDEIGEMPIELQAKLLRVLQEGEFKRLGGEKTQKVDVRVIAATNRDLQEEVEKGNFREDLYYRLNVFPIHSLPLRERKEDIPLLVEHFIQKHGPKIGRNITNIPTKVLKTLDGYHWPGNIRELENLIERALILSFDGKLDLGGWVPIKKKKNVQEELLTLEQLEKQHIERVLEETGWRVSGVYGAAKILDINPKTLESRMKKLGIKRPGK